MEIHYVLKVKHSEWKVMDFVSKEVHLQEIHSVFLGIQLAHLAK